MQRILVAAFVVCLLTGTGSAAQAGTTPLDWSERHARYARHLVLTYSVDELTIGHGWWRAKVRVRNETNLRVRLHANFALLADRPGSRRVLRATRSSPTLPRMIPILGTWRGVVGGPGVPARSSMLRVRFGTTSVVILPNHRITHVTRQATRR